jgi:toxin FitB
VKVIDSSGWLEFFADGPLASAYAEHLSSLDQILTPTIVLFEVYKWIKRERTEGAALVAVAQISKTRLVPISPALALAAADLSLEHRLAMADSMVYATAVSNEADLITSDADFARLPGVRYLPKT